MFNKTKKYSKCSSAARFIIRAMHRRRNIAYKEIYAFGVDMGLNDMLQRPVTLKIVSSGT